MLDLLRFRDIWRFDEVLGPKTPQNGPNNAVSQAKNSLKIVSSSSSLGCFQIFSDSNVLPQTQEDATEVKMKKLGLNYVALDGKQAPAVLDKVDSCWAGQS